MKKSKEKEKQPDLSSLLVFGYACKLFRDDEKALSIERGSHLIPWMGDPSLKIDRYDGRGHLHRLDPPVGEAEGGGFDELDMLERHEEELAEEERWRALENEEQELQEKKEEEEKRADGTRGEFSFNYSQEEGVEGAQGEEYGPEFQEGELEEEEPYKPAPHLMLPPGMATPPTIKMFSVVEKTALFLANQGPQMEILLRAKQSGNPVFEFLAPDHTIYPFFRHIKNLAKTNQYKREASPPSLVPQYSDFPPLPRLPIPSPSTAPFRPSEDCSYSKLIDKIKSVVPPPPAAPAPTVAPTPEATLPVNPAPLPPPLAAAGTPPPVPSPQLEESPPIVIPPPATQTIIDKMASYVAKNGRSFEEVVLSKDKSRFSFLSSGDVHHQYYLHKLAIYTTGKYDPSVKSEPLTFTVKKSEPPVPADPVVPIINALPQENSDSEEESEKDAHKNGDDEKTSSETQPSKRSGFPNLVGFLPSQMASIPPPVLVAEPKLYKAEDEDKEKKEQEDLARKKREETNKLRDKLAARAKEKMIQAAKEKALQLERKRKAAEFLADLAKKKTTVSSAEAVDGEGEGLGGESSAEEGELLELVGGSNSKDYVSVC